MEPISEKVYFWQKEPTKWFWLGLLLVALIGGIVKEINTQNKPGYRGEYDDSDYDAFYIAKNVVESALKAPSTAEFCDFDESRVTRYGDIVTVKGFVDAQNSFGAMLRSDWSVEMQGYRLKKAKLLRVIIDGKDVPID